jgi:hypothetical protein
MNLYNNVQNNVVSFTINDWLQFAIHNYKPNLVANVINN